MSLPELPIRIEYTDETGELLTTELFYGMDQAEVRTYLLQAEGKTILRWVRQTIDGRSWVNTSQYPSPWCR